MWETLPRGRHVRTGWWDPSRCGTAANSVGKTTLTPSYEKQHPASTWDEKLILEYGTEEHHRGNLNGQPVKDAGTPKETDSHCEIEKNARIRGGDLMLDVDVRISKSNPTVMQSPNPAVTPTVFAGIYKVGQTPSPTTKIKRLLNSNWTQKQSKTKV